MKTIIYKDKLYKVMLVDDYIYASQIINDKVSKRTIKISLKYKNLIK